MYPHRTFTISQPSTSATEYETYEPQSNLLYERYRFFERCQKSEELLSDFVEAVSRLAKTCAFDGLEESLVRDRVIFGLKDAQLKNEIIERGGDPSLGEAIDLCNGGLWTNPSALIKEEPIAFESVGVEREHFSIFNYDIVIVNKCMKSFTTLFNLSVNLSVH